MQAELERMNMENQQLRELLNQVTVKYNTLQTHFVTMMQQQTQPTTEVNNKKTSNDGDRGGGEVMIVPRPFMDLGLAAPTAVETDNNSQSSSEEKSHDEQSRSPRVVTNNTIDQRDESSEQGSHVTRDGSNKAPRLNPSKNNTSSANNIDQATEATIRKARVSVRARSEAPMVRE